MSRTLGFRERLLLGAVLPALVMVGLLEMIFVSRYQTDLERAFHDRGRAIARQLGPAVEYALFTGSRDTLDVVAHATRESDPLILAVSVLDVEGRVLSHSGKALQARPPLQGQLQVIDGPTLTTVMAPVMKNLLPLDGDWGATPSVTQSLAGYVVLEISREELSQRRLEMLQITLLIMLAGFLLASWLSIRIGAAVARPISHISDVVERFGRGDMAARVSHDAAGVLAPLETGINLMAERIAGAQQELQSRIDQATEALRRQKEAAETLARTDVLTGLLNRRALDELVRHEIQRAMRYGSRLSVIMTDIDHFKAINDQHGHHAGDQVLVNVTRVIRESVREVDRVGRWGGEEFVILMPGTGMDEALQVAERMRLAIAATPTRLDKASCGCTASFGVADLSPTMTTPEALFQCVDAALYLAKQRGRNRIEIG